MAWIKHQSRIKERTRSAVKNTLVYQGSFEEMAEIQEENAVDVVNGEIGRITSSRIYQTGASIWECELVSELDNSGNAVIPPDTAFGQKSAQLHGSMLVMPLESHPDYKTAWNYYLFAAPGVQNFPAWWGTATDTLISEEESEKYAWGKTLADAPATGKKRWRSIKKPFMPGVDTYDASTYSLTISARFASFSAGCKMVANVLNTVHTSPGVDTGITGGDWKCDDGTVVWHEKYWLATLTWTRSGGKSGWNNRLYGGRL